MPTMVASKAREFDNSVQVLRTKKYGQVRVGGKFWMDGPGPGRIIVLTPEGGYRFARGGPIRSEQDITNVIPEGPDRDRALEWFANKDNWQKIAPRKLTFNREGYPIYEDTGEFVEDGGVIQSYFPNGPVQWGALQAMLNRQQGVKPEPSVTLKAVQNEPAAPPTPPELSAEDREVLRQANLKKAQAAKSAKGRASQAKKKKGKKISPAPQAQVQESATG